MAGFTDEVPVTDQITELYSYSAMWHKLFTTQEHQFICAMEKKNAFLHEGAKFSELELNSLKELYNRFLRPKEEH